MGLYRRPDSDIYWMSFTHNNRLYRKSTGTSDEKLAKKILAKVHTQIVEDKWFDIDRSKHLSLQDMIERYDKEYTAHREYYSQKRDRSIFKNLYAYFGKTCTLGEIEREIGGYEQFRKTKSISSATIIKELGLLRTMFNIARKQWRWKIINPVSDIKLPRMRNKRVRYLSEDEYKNLLETLETSEEKWLKTFVVIAIDTGLRLSNLCGLKCLR